jgi:hypothetical protein
VPHLEGAHQIELKCNAIMTQSNPRFALDWVWIWVLMGREQQTTNPVMMGMLVSTPHREPTPIPIPIVNAAQSMLVSRLIYDSLLSVFHLASIVQLLDSASAAQCEMGSIVFSLLH